MPPHICIIGAGVSGLRCATVLLEHGFKVTILEARDRIGGRIAQSKEMGPIPVDTGANWVHSTEHNPIFELARTTHTDVHLWDPRTLIINRDGSLVDPELANDALQTVWRILEKAVAHSKSDSTNISFGRSLYDFFVEECSNEVQSGRMKAEYAELVKSMSQMWGAYVGTAVEKQSLKYFFLEDCIDADDYFIPSNYVKIMTEISRQPLDKARVLLNTKMELIHSYQNGEDDNLQVEVLGDGFKEAFDSVVLTTPLGWLKRNLQRIKPCTEEMLDAIKSVSYGNLEKVLIEFPSAFWEDATQLAVGKVTSFVHWLSPDYAPDSNPLHWRLECVSFAAFPEQYRRNILLFYTYGECSLKITSMVHGKTGTERNRLLQSFFEPYYSRLPNYHKGSCKPVRFLATEWSNDELAGFGSYCNFQVGVQKADRHVSNMRHGMPDYGIYFAGEHTAPFDGLGTVAGAYSSGEAVAYRLLKDLGTAPRST